MDKTAFREALIARLDLTGMPAAELARRTGVSKTIIDKLRQRRVEVTNVNDAVLIARFFGQSVEDFMGIRSSPGKRGVIDEITLELSAMPPNLQKVALAQLRALREIRGR